MTSTVDHPRTASHDQWLAERKTLLAHEKALKSLELVNAERRRLPMVKVEKDYAFDAASQRIRATCFGSHGTSKRRQPLS